MMRLKSIVIDSFGRLKGKTFILDPGLNVFYGPNESGKSTTMEFIRCTLVPNKSNKSSCMRKTDWKKEFSWKGRPDIKGMLPNAFLT